MLQVVTRYSAAPYHVKVWEIWNEPDVAHQLVGLDSQFGCWGDQDDDYYGGGYYGDAKSSIRASKRRTRRPRYWLGDCCWTVTRTMSA